MISRSRRLSDHLRRAMGSWMVLTLALVALGGLGVVAVSLLQTRSHEQAITAAVEDARVITRLTAVRDIGSENATQPLSARDRADLDGDVAQLRDGGDLLELSIRRSSGTLLYRGGVAHQDDGQSTALSANHPPIVRFLTVSGTGLSPTRAIAVELPAAVNRTEPPLILEVTIPARRIENLSSWATTMLTGSTLLMLFVVGGGLAITRRRVRQRSYQASHDSLTGLGNRLLLEQAADGLFARHEPFALLMMDLDGFKRVNDSLGHAAGDQLLVLVAGALRRTIRARDLLVRLGGDEYAVLMPGLVGPGVEAAAHRLLSGVRAQFTTRGVAVDCDASVGAAVAYQDANDFGELLQAADIAMYQAKRGKLGVRLFAESEEEIDASDLQSLIDLRRAIDNGELVLHYQPAVAINAGRETDGGHYLEALVRWQHPTRGFLSPDQFIPLAEDTALIHPLTNWVLNEAARQCASWRLDGLDVTIAVNVSPRSLTYPGLVQTVVDTLSRHQLPTEAIHLEITESAVLSRPELAHEILTQLRDRGVCISIDDFGTGYTSLAHLKTLPIETLKIDRCFVSDLLTDASDQTVVTAIINLGHGLGMQVIAEGVEDAPTLQRLADLGCDLAQGFHLSRPLATADATRWLRQQTNLSRVDLPVR